MNINCIIVDDEPLARELLESYIARLPQLRLVASCANAMDAYVHLENSGVDLMFLDIEMPVLKGNNFLKGLNSPPAVIITTAYREYALEGYELNVVDYLLKPIIFDRFFNAVDKLCRQTIARKKEDTLFVQSGGKHIRLILQDVLFVESLKDYITIHFENAPDIHVKCNISVFQKMLDERFLRVHRSYIVNKDKITSFSKYDLWINAIELPIGDSYQPNWRSYMQATLSKRG